MRKSLQRSTCEAKWYTQGFPLWLFHIVFFILFYLDIFKYFFRWSFKVWCFPAIFGFSKISISTVQFLKGELSSFPNLCAEIPNSMPKWLFQSEFLRNVIVDAFKHTSITFFDQNASKRVCVIKNILQIGPNVNQKAIISGNWPEMLTRQSLSTVTDYL